MVFENINLLDPSTWIWGAILIVLITFIGILLKVFVGRKEP